MPRFLFVDLGQRSGDGVALDSEQTHYLLRVLRLEPGDSLDLVPRGGRERWSARLGEALRGRALARVESAWPLPEPVGPGLSLYLAALKTDKLEWALQKTVELGVDAFVVLAARHSVRATREVPPRFQAIAESACQQSGRTSPPRLAAVDLAGAIARLRQEGGQALVLHPEAPRLADLPLDISKGVSYFIGPEGGFAPEELSELEGAGARRARLDGHILRAETAAVAVAAILLSRLGRL